MNESGEMPGAIPSAMGETEREERGPAWSWLEILGLGCLLLAAVLIRLYKLDCTYWYDETLTHEGASLPVSEIVTHRYNFLYYLLGHFALKLGDSEVALRMPSLLAGVAGVLAIYLFARAVAGRSAALFAAVLFALSVDQVHRSQEARYYAFVALASILLTWSAWRIVRRGGRESWMAFALSANMGIGMQLTVVPYVATLLATVAVLLFVSSAENPRRHRWRTMVAVVISGALSLSPIAISTAVGRNLPASPVVHEKSDNAVDGGDELSEDLGDPAGYRLTFAKYGKFLESFVPGQSSATRVAWAIPLIVGVGYVVRRRPQLAILLGTQAAIVPLPFFWIHVDHFFRDRYFFNLAPFYPLLIGIGLMVLMRGFGVIAERLRASARGRTAIEVVVCSVMLALIVTTGLRDLNGYFSAIPARDWRAAGEYLANSARYGDVIAYTRPIWHPKKEERDRGDVEYAGCPSIEFYLRRGLNDRRTEITAGTYDSLQFVAANTPEQIEEVLATVNHGSIHFVSINEEKAAKVLRRRLESLPKQETFKVNGINVRQVPRGGPSS